MNDFFIKISIYFICFLICLYGLSALDFNRFVKQGKVSQAQVLYFILAGCMAYLFGNFLMSLVYYFY